jgi:hypothetical protein
MRPQLSCTMTAERRVFGLPAPGHAMARPCHGAQQPMPASEMGTITHTPRGDLPGPPADRTALRGRHPVSTQPVATGGSLGCTDISSQHMMGLTPLIGHTNECAPDTCPTGTAHPPVEQLPQSESGGPWGMWPTNTPRNHHQHSLACKYCTVGRVLSSNLLWVRVQVLRWRCE